MLWGGKKKKKSRYLHETSQLSFQISIVMMLKDLKPIDKWLRSVFKVQKSYFNSILAIFLTFLVLFILQASPPKEDQLH